MPRLLNQFDLKPDVTVESFEKAWHAFVDCLVENDLAATGKTLCTRVPESGCDTDEGRNHALMAVIEFRNQTQADAAWAAIEDRIKPLDRLHRGVTLLVHDPVFTFWVEL